MPFVTSETHDGICTLRLDHGKPNSISEPVSQELMAAFDEAEATADAIVLLGKPGMFSAGFDLPTMAQGPDAAKAMVTAGGRLLMKIYNHAKPVVIGCTGHAIAMGAFITLAGDYRIGARGAFKIGANETAIGMTLPAFALELSRERISKRYFDRTVVHATIYDPEGAVAAGFLDEVVDADQVEAAAHEAAKRLATLKQPAFRNNKRLAHAQTVEYVLSTLDADMAKLNPGAS